MLLLWSISCSLDLSQTKLYIYLLGFLADIDTYFWCSDPFKIVEINSDKKNNLKSLPRIILNNKK